MSLAQLIHKLIKAGIRRIVERKCELRPLASRAKVPRTYPFIVGLDIHHHLIFFIHRPDPQLRKTYVPFSKDSDELTEA